MTTALLTPAATPTVVVQPMPDSDRRCWVLTDDEFWFWLLPEPEMDDELVRLTEATTGGTLYWVWADPTCFECGVLSDDEGTSDDDQPF